MKLLVIDDDEFTLQQVTAMYGDIRLPIFQATDAEKGIEFLQSVDEPVIVILDIMMPGNDGFTFCQLVRNISINHSPFIIAHSSMEEADVLVRILESGADDFVQKGQSRSVLLARINVAQRNLEYRLEQSQRIRLLDQELTNAYDQHLLNTQVTNLVAFNIKSSIEQTDIERSKNNTLYWVDCLHAFNSNFIPNVAFSVRDIVDSLRDHFGESIYSLRFQSLTQNSDKKNINATYEIVDLVAKSLIQYVAFEDLFQNINFKITDIEHDEQQYLEFNLICEISEFVLAQQNVEMHLTAKAEVNTLHQITELLGGYFDSQKHNAVIHYRLGLPVVVKHLHLT